MNSKGYIYVLKIQAKRETTPKGVDGYLVAKPVRVADIFQNYLKKVRSVGKVCIGRLRVRKASPKQLNKCKERKYNPQERRLFLATPVAVHYLNLPVVLHSYRHNSAIWDAVFFPSIWINWLRKVFVKNISFTDFPGSLMVDTQTAM